MKQFFIKIFLLAAIVAVAALFVFGPRFFHEGKTVAFVVANGATVHSISNGLKNQGFIRSRFIFESVLWLRIGRAPLRAGEYQLSRSWSVGKVVDVLVSGQGRHDVRVTLIEGWTLADYKDYLKKLDFDVTSFDTLVKDLTFWESKFSFVKSIPASATLEGYVFPDTYLVDLDRNVSDVLMKALSNFDAKVTAQMVLDMERKKLTLDQVITMASVVEKEVQTNDDRRMVADIFYRRMQQGLALQSDATLNYVLRTGNASLSAADLESKSPYNTYRFKGLPPTPICNPGVDSISAAIYPKANDYLYFLTDKDGTVHYAKTFEEHKRNKERYL